MEEKICSVSLLGFLDQMNFSFEKQDHAVGGRLGVSVRCKGTLRKTRNAVSILELPKYDGKNQKLARANIRTPCVRPAKAGAAGAIW